HQAGRPSNLTIVHNTVIGDGTGISVRNVSGRVVIANNAVYSRSAAAIRVVSGDIARVTVAGNVGVGGLRGLSRGFTTGNLVRDFVAARHGGVPPIDVCPRGGGALVGVGDPDYSTDLDFNGVGRAGAVDVGAYRFSSGGNPGWALASELKSLARKADFDAVMR